MQRISSGRYDWTELHAAFDDLRPGEGIEVELETMAWARQARAALAYHVAAHQRGHPEANWRLRTQTRRLPDGHVVLWAGKISRG